MTRVIIADDHTLFRIGLKRMLESYEGITIVAEAANAEQTLAATATIYSNLLITDLSMPGANGMQLIETLRQRHPALSILVLSMHDEPMTVRHALQAGATGYLTKEASPETLFAAVIKTAAGERFIAPEIAAAIAFDTVSPRFAAHERLSERETQVFRLIAAGSSLTQIGEQLHLSPKTITTHKKHLMEKLGVGNNAELIRYAVEHQLFV